MSNNHLLTCRALIAPLSNAFNAIYKTLRYPRLPLISSAMPPIVHGQTFANLLDFKDALREWAIEANWTPHILDSDKHRVRAGCRSSPDCPFKIRCNYYVKTGNASVTIIDENHTCRTYSQEGPAHQGIKRAESTKLKFLIEVVPKLMTVTLNTSCQEIIAVIEQKYGQKIALRQAQKVKGALVQRVKGPCRQCHRMGHTKRHCPQLLRDSLPVPVDYSSQHRPLSYSPNYHDDDTYANSGIREDAFAPEVEYDGQDQQPNLYHQHHRPASDDRFQQQSRLDPGLSNDANGHYSDSHRPPTSSNQPDPSQPDGTQSSSPQYAASRRPPRPEPPPSSSDAFVPMPDASWSPEEARKEAHKLMKQATQLMQQAARMNAEASKLLSTIGEPS